MKLFSTLGCLLFIFTMQAQICDIDYSQNDPGSYPAQLSDGTVSQFYDQDLTIIFPQDNGNQDYMSFQITSIELPLGLSWECLDETNGCTISPQEEPYFCINIYGTPAEEVSGYTVNVNAKATLADNSEEDYTTSTLLDINLPESTNMFFTIRPSELCEGGTVDFTNNSPISYTPIQGVTAGATYTWDFGNGNNSLSENPVGQNYNTPGTYTVSYTRVVDTIGFVLKTVRITNVGCDDAIGYGNPDIYIEIYDGDNNKVYTSGVDDSNLPVVFNMNLMLTNPPYTINVMDDDSDNLWGTADDNCVNGDENDYPVSFGLPDVDQYGLTTKVGGTGALSFSYDVNKKVTTNQMTGTILVHANPAAPLLTMDTDAPLALYTDDNDDYIYHWNQDGNRAYEYRGSEIHPQEAGTYNVMVVDEHGCYQVSNNEVVDFTGLSVETGAAFNIYPNPAIDVVNMDFTQAVSNGTISIVDLSGRVVYTDDIAYENQVQIDVSSLRKGMYTVIFTDNNAAQTTRKLVVQ